MRIPDGSSGFPTVSASQLRVYGAGADKLDSHEVSRGCPALYKARYVDRTVKNVTHPRFAYGTYWHKIMELMESGQTPDEAIVSAFPADGDPAMITEARSDMVRYLERAATPADLYGALATEQDLSAMLYEDEEFGPVYWRSIIDWVGVDLDDPRTLHGVDYKTNQFPPSVEQVAGDVQLKGYAWTLKQCSEKFGIPTNRVRVVMHLDAIKWREIEAFYSDADLEDWHDWAVAVCRTILRDDTAKPIVNPGCSECPIRSDCPAFQALPDKAVAMAHGIRDIPDAAQRLAWRDAANSVRLLLEKEVAAIDAEFKAVALHRGSYAVGSTVYESAQEWKDSWDLPRLHSVLGDDFYKVVNPVKKRIQELAKTFTDGRELEVERCLSRQPGSLKVTRRDGKDARGGEAV